MERFWVRTGARLHLGQFDLNGSAGRLYGGAGLAIDQPYLELAAEKSDKFLIISADEEEKARAEKIAREYLSHYHLPGIKINLAQTLPSHSGLGSGTQLCLALGFAISRVYGLACPLHELAEITDRESSRSGIGVAAFEQGGLLVDGGKSVQAVAENSFKIPPLVARLAFPPEWSILVALPRGQEKLFGSAEKKVFQTLEPMTEQMSGAICRLVLMKLLPALCEEDLTTFGEGINEIQSYLGDYFTPVQGGRYASPTGADLADFWLKLGVAGVGQSSWGPAVYGFITKKNEESFLQQTREFLGGGEPVFVAKGRNQGASWGWS